MYYLSMFLTSRRRWVLSILGGLLLLAIMTRVVRQFVLHYPPTSDPAEAAQWIVERNYNPDRCLKMPDDGIPFLPIMLFPAMGPTIEDKRSLCVFKVAQLIQDPSVCELLMPSRYGLDCALGAMKDNICTFVDKDVWWAEGDSDKKMKRSDCIKPDQKISFTGSACCIISIVSSVLSENDCSPLSANARFYDECQFRLAFKNRDPLVCETIVDTNVKAGCLVNAKALKQDPSICRGCTSPVDRIEDFPK